MFEEILVRHPFFHQLNPDQLREIALHCEQLNYETGEYIFKEGKKADRFFLVLHGQVALEIHDPGRGPLIIQTLCDEDLMGWSWLFSPNRWHFDARAVKPTRLLAIEGSWLHEQIEADPKLGYLFMSRVAQIMFDRLQATRLQLMDIYSKEPAQPMRGRKL
ncbi:MAG: cyclic nucleotide-binding domain-containing protein [Chloroflexi bacterium]|nr:cyclic nucleotide-binding domain-containing protein [Chloroflexota bacterium]OJW01869.1 MAG: hypothetical protein BGO39_28370 [Chloroflexi bacterium 54-19]